MGLGAVALQNIRLNQALRVAASDVLESALKSRQGDVEALVRDNDLNVSSKSLKRWINAVDAQQDISENRFLKRIDAKILNSFAEIPGIQVRARDVRAKRSLERIRGDEVAALTASGEPPLAHLCRVLCYKTDDPTHRVPVSSGTGFRLTNRLVLTCRHVLPTDISDCKVLFKFPEYDSEYLGEAKDTPIHAVKVYEATRTAGHACVLLESPKREDKIETADWNGATPHYKKDSYDFALLEIDYNTAPKWQIRVEGTLDHLGPLNLYQVLRELKRGTPPLSPPNAPYSASELLDLSVEVRLITKELWYDTLHGGISKANEAAQRVRYNQKGTKFGDSGAPLVEVIDEQVNVVAIHQGQTRQGGQAVPVGPILETIRDSSLDDTHKDELVSFGWLLGS